MLFLKASIAFSGLFCASKALPSSSCACGNSGNILSVCFNLLTAAPDRFCLMRATQTPIVTKRIKIVAKALMSGDTPNLTFEKINMGKVVAPGPETKLDMTRSSRESVNARSHPEIIAGKIIGSVISQITLTGFAPRSIAASSSDS